MVERTAAGEAPSSPQPPEAGARRARLYGVSSVAENRNRQTMSSAGAVPAGQCGVGSGSADLEHVADLPLATRCGLAASFCTFDLPLADVPEDGTEVFVLDNGSLRNLPQFVEGAVRQLDTVVADRQPAIGIIEYSHPLADRRLSLVTRRENKNHLVILQGQRPR